MSSSAGNLDPQAVQLNETIEKANPAVLTMLSCGKAV